jgi:hypothetical protein
VEWLEAASALLPAPDHPAPAAATTPAVLAISGKSAETRVYFSPQDECVAAIQEFIREARQTLDVCSDNRLTDELLAAHRRA